MRRQLAGRLSFGPSFETFNAQSSGLAIKSSGRPKSEIPTGAGVGIFLLEHRKFASAMRVQSHREHSRPEVAAPVCAISLIRQQMYRQLCPLPCIGVGNVRIADALSRHGGPTWLRNSIPRHTTSMPPTPAKPLRPTGTS